MTHPNTPSQRLRALETVSLTLLFRWGERAPRRSMGDPKVM